MDLGNKHEQALRVFNGLCANLDAHHWRYDKNEGELTIDCQAQGDDLPMEIRLEVHEERRFVTLLSHQPFVVKEEKRLDMAVAVSVVNNMLLDGSFDFDIKNGHMFFRMTSSYIDSLLGDELFSYMIGLSLKVIDDFNDKFFMLSSGMITIEQFLEITSKK